MMKPNTQLVVGEDFSVTSDKAMQWLATKDRSILGAFAVDAHKVCAYYNSGYGYDTLAFLSGVSKRYDTINPIAEYIFWASQEKGERPAVDDHRIRARLKLLNTLAFYPEYLSYFEAGVFNIEHIKKCVADDIDPMLAAVVT